MDTKNFLLTSLGHVTRKSVSEMTYNVSSGTLNSTIPYYIIDQPERVTATLNRAVGLSIFCSLFYYTWALSEGIGNRESQQILNFHRSISLSSRLSPYVFSPLLSVLAFMC